MMEDRLLAGRYKKEQIAGEGGITRVYQAFDNYTGKKVAIKELKQTDPVTRQALIDEYNFSALNRHPSLVAPVSLINGENYTAVVQEFIEGTGAEDWWQKNKTDLESVNNIIASLLECASFIHFAGYLYNDFKPSNILVSVKGNITRLFLLDYNLVSQKGQTLSRRGTIEYIAPEVLRGDQPEIVSDIYSIGATLYELFTGKPPFTSNDNKELIRLITEEGRIDYSMVQSELRDGLSAILSRNPDERPANARQAAAALGLEPYFDKLARQRAEYYLSAGEVPFAAELFESLEKYINGMSSKIFAIRSLNHNKMAMNSISLKYEPAGYEIVRLSSHENPQIINEVIVDLRSRSKQHPDRNRLLLIDSYENLDKETIQHLQVAVGPVKGFPIAIGIGRWTDPAIPAIIFDPLNNNTKHNSTVELFKTYSKHTIAESDADKLCRITGGDPELIYQNLISNINFGFNLDEDKLPAIPDSRPPLTDISTARVEGILANLKPAYARALKTLAVWGDTIPMLILCELDSDGCGNIDELLRLGRLVPEKDSVSFPSGLARDYVYSIIDPVEKKCIHRFWAQAADKRFSDLDEYPELSALHWGLSDDLERGYKANLTATKHLMNKGDLTSAKKHALRSLELADKGGIDRKEALALYASILKGEGDYRAARQYYLDLLRMLGISNEKTEIARTFKELGDIYRSLKKTRRAIYYTGKALKIFIDASDDQGIADCSNNMGLTFWIEGKFEKALESFSRAFEANLRVENHRELAKIQSNIGIIKDIIGRTGEVSGHFLKAKHHAVEAGDPRLEALISNNLGYFFIRQGDYGPASSYLRDALAISEKIGYTEGAINSLSNLGLCYLRSGDLFVAVDSCQQALETAESFGNKHLAASAESYLAEACILMGNYELADRVLYSIETGKAYLEDKILKPQILILRSRLASAIGDYKKASKFAEIVLQEADAIGDKRLDLEGRYCLALSGSAAGQESASTILSDVIDRASKLGHIDLLSSACVAMAEICIEREDYFPAESWIEKAMSSDKPAKEIEIKAGILTSEIGFRNGVFDKAIQSLYEYESAAAVSGFIPLAFKASIILCEIFLSCSKLARAGEAGSRANSYRSRILAAVPSEYPSSNILATSDFTRYDRAVMKFESKEFLML